MSTDPTFIRVSTLDLEHRNRIVIRRDRIHPGRVYCEFPKYASLTPEQAIKLANRLADVLEDAGA